MPDILLDTNILLRSVDPASPLHADAVRSVASLLERDDRLHITAQNLIEFWAVATRPVEANGFGWEPARTAIEVARLQSTFLFLKDSPEVFPCWLDLVSKAGVRGKRVHDARLVAVMTIHKIPRLLTFNVDDFAPFAEIQAIDAKGFVG